MIPMDTVKTRLVTQTAQAGVVPYKGVLGTLTRIVREEGLGPIYRSLTPRLVSVVPMIGIQVCANARSVVRTLLTPALWCVFMWYWYGSTVENAQCYIHATYRVFVARGCTSDGDSRVTLLGAPQQLPILKEQAYNNPKDFTFTKIPVSTRPPGGGDGRLDFPLHAPVLRGV